LRALNSYRPADTICRTATSPANTCGFTASPTSTARAAPSSSLPGPGRLAPVMARRARRHPRRPTHRSGAHAVQAVPVGRGSGQGNLLPASRQPLGARRRTHPMPLRRRLTCQEARQERPATTHPRRWWTADVAAHHRIRTGLVGYHLSKAESLLARIGQRRPIRLTPRPASAGASPPAVQSCLRCRLAGACNEPTDRRGGRVVSEAQNRSKPPTDSPEEPVFLTKGQLVFLSKAELVGFSM